VPQADSPKAPRAEPAARPKKVRRLVRGFVIDPPGEAGEAFVESLRKFSKLFERLVQDRNQLAIVSRAAFVRILAYT
jgi:hypothetical protein